MIHRQASWGLRRVCSTQTDVTCSDLEENNNDNKGRRGLASVLHWTHLGLSPRLFPSSAFSNWPLFPAAAAQPAVHLYVWGVSLLSQRRIDWHRPVCVLKMKLQPSHVQLHSCKDWEQLVALCKHIPTPPKLVNEHAVSRLFHTITEMKAASWGLVAWKSLEHKHWTALHAALSPVYLYGYIYICISLMNPPNLALDFYKLPVFGSHGKCSPTMICVFAS